MDVGEPVGVIAVIIPLRCRKLKHPIAHLQIIADQVMGPSVSVEGRDREHIPVEGRTVDAGHLEGALEPVEVDGHVPAAEVVDDPRWLSREHELAGIRGIC